MRASPGTIDGAAGTAGAAGATADGTTGGLSSAAGASPVPVTGASAGVVVVVGGVVSGARPIWFNRRTMSTPLRLSVELSLALACWRKKSIASRIVASRNSIRGMMMVLSLAEMRAVPLVSLAKASTVGVLFEP